MPHVISIGRNFELAEDEEEDEDEAEPVTPN